MARSPLLRLALVPLLSACATTASMEDRLVALEESQAAMEEDYVRLLREDVTVEVPGVSDMWTALSDLDQVVLASGTTYTLQLTSSEYVFDAPLVIAHPTGGRILIEGLGSGATTLRFTGSGIAVGEGSALGLLKGVTLENASKPQDTVGVQVSDGASISLEDVKVEGFWTGLEAKGSSILRATGKLEVARCGQVGVHASEGAFIVLPEGATIQGNGQHGVLAEAAGVRASVVTSFDNTAAGFKADMGGVVIADEAMGNLNHEGFHASHGGHLAAGGAEANGNTNVGFDGDHGGFLYVDSALVSNNVNSDVSSEYGAVVLAGAIQPLNTGGAVSMQAFYNGFIYAVGATGNLDTASSCHNTTDFILLECE